MDDKLTLHPRNEPSVPWGCQMVNPMILCTSNGLHRCHFRKRASLRQSTGDSEEYAPGKASRPSIREHGVHVPTEGYFMSRHEP